MTNSFYNARMLGLPELTSANDLALALRIPAETLKKYTQRSWSAGYKTFTIPKKPTGVRTIHSPTRELKYIQAWILRNILAPLRSSHCATAFEPGNNILANAACHIGQAYVVNLDIRDFFPSIKANKVSQIFFALGYSKEICWLLTNLVTYKGSLPQGSPASPKLANLICHRLDARISGYCNKKNMRYTRYADDITISTSNRKHLKGVIRFIEYVAGNEGFGLRPEKTAVYGQHKAKKVTGLIVSDSVGIGRRRYREMRAIIQRAIIDHDHPKLAYVDGYLNFLKGVDRSAHQKLFDYRSSILEKSTHPTLQKAVSA